MPTSLAFKARFSRVHYAWVIVAVSFVTAVIIAGTLGISGVLLVSLQRDFGWQSSDISSAFGIRLALYGLLGPFSAALMNRFGVRRMVTIALFIILSGLAATIFVKTAWQFFSGVYLPAWEQASRPWFSMQPSPRDGSSSIADL